MEKLIIDHNLKLAMDPEDILSSSLLTLYDYQPVTLSSAGSIFSFTSTAPDQTITKVTLRTPDTQAANWSLHASSVWAASRFLADHLHLLELSKHTSQCSPGKRVKLLELGAAAGLPGILIAARNPQVSVTVSDYPDADLIRTLAENVAENGVSANCRATPYAWGSRPSDLFLPDGEKFDMVIAADTLWNPEFHGIFVESLKLTLERTPQSRIHLFAGLHTGRYTIQSFLVRPFAFLS
ncbi:putative methyltransferase-domain-containing protein [Mycena pura]|uniref:Methyltransferase-domain-containing protein n=1 Tax=Mycena pura TaxID=153505 RepID=A0AAD6YMQ8_9AGAR|nr:putative methyltransferase-domain-containing protein [Mycena pura]